MRCCAPSRRSTASSVENEDQKVGINIVKKALQAPARQIFTNAGEDGSVIVGKILENAKYNFGYNAQTHEYGDLVAEGVIDPAKVVRCALQDAASVAGLLITTEAMVAELPKKEHGHPRCRAAAWVAWAGWTSKVRSRRRLVDEWKSPGRRPGLFRDLVGYLFGTVAVRTHVSLDGDILSIATCLTSRVRRIPAQPRPFSPSSLQALLETEG